MVVGREKSYSWMDGIRACKCESIWYLVFFFFFLDESNDFFTPSPQK